MRRRDLIAALGSAVALPHIAVAQQPMPTIGFLASGERGSFTPELTGFHQGLSDSGFVEGRTVAIEYRWADNHTERLPALATELVQRRVDVLASVGGTVTARAAKQATSAIPIVFVLGSDPVRQGLVASLSRPGFNATGVTFLTLLLGAKRLEIMRELLPQVTSYAALFESSSPTFSEQSRELQAAAHSLNLKLELVKANMQNLNATVAGLAGGRVQAMIVSADPIFTNRRKEIIAVAARHRIPTIYPRVEYVAAGGLISYSARVPDSYRLAGRYVGRILKGEKPSDLPVVQAEKFELSINLKTAKALGLTVPPTLIARADEVIE